MKETEERNRQTERYTQRGGFWFIHHYKVSEVSGYNITVVYLTVRFHLLVFYLIVEGKNVENLLLAAMQGIKVFFKSVSSTK